MQYARQAFDGLVEHTNAEYRYGSVVINAAQSGDVVVFSFPRNFESNTINETTTALKASRAANIKADMRDAMKLEMKIQRIQVYDEQRFLLKFRIYDYEKVFSKVKHNNGQMYATLENEAKGFSILFTNEGEHSDCGTRLNAILTFKNLNEGEHSFKCAIQHEGEVSTRGIAFWIEPDDASIDSDIIQQLIKKLVYAASFNNEEFLRETTRWQAERIEVLETDIQDYRAQLRALDARRRKRGTAAAGDTSDSDSS